MDEVPHGDANMRCMTDDTPDITSAPASEEAPDNPLHKKLGMRAGITGAIVAGAEHDELLSPLPDGFTAFAGVDELTAAAGQFDYIQVFAHSRADLVKDFNRLRDKLAPSGSLWVAWIKPSSGRRGGGLPGDLNENTIRRLAVPAGLVDVKVAALDAEWAALKLVWRRH